MPRENAPIIGVIPDPAAGRAFGRRALMARIDATADLVPGLTEAERAERIREARRRHFAELGRRGGLAKAAKRAERQGGSDDGTA